MSPNANRRARRNLIAGGTSAAVALATYATVVSAHEGSAGGDRPTGVYQLSDAEAEAVRAYVAPYADPAAAVEAGLVDLELCFDMMGDHFADPATFGDGVLDAAKPEALVYADVGGTTQLVAVEWVSTAPGEVLGIPLHLNHDLDVWVLHAWIGVDNPSGMLADHNPDIATCPPA